MLKFQSKAVIFCKRLVFSLLTISPLMGGAALAAASCPVGFWQGLDNQLFILDLTNGFYNPIGGPVVKYNSSGFNSADGFIYASVNAPGIDSNGVAVGREDILKINVQTGETTKEYDSPTNLIKYNNADITGGIYYALRRNANVLRIYDIANGTETISSFTGVWDPSDFGIVNNIAYGLSIANGVLSLYKLDITNPSPTVNTQIITSSLTFAKTDFGAGFVQAGGRLFFTNNGGGLYEVTNYDTSAPTITSVGLSAATNQNDGASCPDAVFGATATPANADYSDAPVSGASPNGDATNNYGSASHTIDSNLYMGSVAPDADSANQPSADAGFDGTTGDDGDGSDDDDGISAFPTLTAGDTGYTIPAANITTVGTGTLHAWIDFDGNGTFDVSEHTTLDVNGALSWTNQNTMAAGTTFARFRFTSDTAVTESTPASVASDGEVEDYQVMIANIDAINDNFTSTPINTSGGSTTSVVTADTLNGNANPTIGTDVVISTGTTAQDGTTTLGSTTSGLSINTSTGQIVVAAGTAAGSHTYTYEICEVVNLTNCDTAVATVVVQPAGVTVSGRVFLDVNVNAVNDAGEVGVTNLPVVLYNTSSGTCVSTSTNGNGDYQFKGVAAGNYQVYEVSREQVPVPTQCGPSFAKDPSGYRSTTANALAAFDVSSSNITGKDFGDVKPPVFEPSNNSQILPDNVLFYAHRFTTPTQGTVSFTSVSGSNVTAGWASLIYRDSNCNGLLDGAEGSAAMSGTRTGTATGSTWVSDVVGPLTVGPVTEGSGICLINKVYAPSNVAANDRYQQTITADFTYTNASGVANAIAGTETLTVIDITELGLSRLELRKTVRNINVAGSVETESVNTAKPGDTLEYRIYYRNTGTGPLDELIINDAVPPYTELVSASVTNCGALVSNMTCDESPSGLDVNLKWVFGGVLNGGSGSFVSYQSLIDD